MRSRLEKNEEPEPTEINEEPEPEPKKKICRLPSPAPRKPLSKKFLNLPLVDITSLQIYQKLVKVLGQI